MEEGTEEGWGNVHLITINGIMVLGPVVLIQRLNPMEFCPWSGFSGWSYVIKSL